MANLNFSKRQLIIVAAAVLLVAGFLYVIFAGGKEEGQYPPVSLAFWGTDKTENMELLIASYKQLRPNVTITYTEVAPEEYESRLLEALAAGEGPDVFVIKNTGVSRQKSRLAAADLTQANADTLKIFPTVVAQDALRDGEVYFLPLYMDTLTLFYNRDLLDQAAIAQPPQTWDEFQKDVVKLRSVTPAGQILRAGAAIGGTKQTVHAASDLLAVLMFQNGATVWDEQNQTFKFASENNFGMQALDFYLQFVNPLSGYYTWSESQPNDLQAFAEGKAAMIFAYRSELADLKAKTPFLNFGVAPLPQVPGTERIANYASYEGLAVSKQSQAAGWAWDFALYTTTNNEIMKPYLDAAGKLPALKTALSSYPENSADGIFAKAAFTARSFFMPDDLKVKEILNDTIKNVIMGKFDAARSLRQAEEQMNQFR